MIAEIGGQPNFCSLVDFIFLLGYLSRGFPVSFLSLTFP